MLYSIMSGPPPQPISIFIPRRHARRRFRNGWAELADCLQVTVPHLGLTRPSFHRILGRWASRCHTFRDDPEKLGGVPLQPPGSKLEALRHSLSARVVISFWIHV